MHAVVEQQEEEQVGEPKVRTKRVVKKKREVVIEEGVEESAVKKGKRRRVEVVQVVEAPVVTRSTSWREGASEWIPVGAAEASLSAASSDFDAEDDSDFDDWGEGGAGGGPPSRTEPGLDDLPIQMPVEVQIVKGPIVWHEGPERRRRRTLLVNEEEKVGVGDTLASEVEAAEVECVVLAAAVFGDCADLTFPLAEPYLTSFSSSTLQRRIRRTSNPTSALLPTRSTPSSTSTRIRTSTSSRTSTPFVARILLLSISSSTTLFPLSPPLHQSSSPFLATIPNSSPPPSSLLLPPSTQLPPTVAFRHLGSE